MSINKNILPIITLAQASAKAQQEVEQERSGEQHGLLTSFNTLNISAGKYFRFNNVNLFAGLSGHGKSYFLNKIRNDFTDTTINKNLPFIPVIVAFSFEMSSHVELLRACAADLGVSYSYLLSSEYSKQDRTYNKITNEEFARIKQFLNYYKNRNILYVETTGNVNLVYNTCDYIANNYSKPHPSGKPYRFVFDFDHTLLFEKLDEKDILELMGSVGTLAIKLRKDFNSMVNLLGQLNNNIEHPTRLLNPSLHYPQKSDIYAQGQLYNACDNVYTIMQPELLKLNTYGIKKLPTKRLIHLMKLKARHGNIGSIWFKNALNTGRIIEYNSNKEENLDKNPTFIDE